MPLAYSAPTTLPALVPDTTTGSSPLASSILITPIWAKPLAAPPPSAMPMRISGTVTGATGSTIAGAGSGRVLPPQATSVAARHNSSHEGRRRLVVIGMAGNVVQQIGAARIRAGA